METLNINLNYTEKMELRKFYGRFKSMSYGNADATFETKEELTEARNEAKSEYNTKYPQLSAAGVTIKDLPELIYSKNQLQFIEDAEQTHFKIDYDYSGRGMYGDCCPSITCDSHNDIQTTAKTEIDNMGLQIVIYAKN